MTTLLVVTGNPSSYTTGNWPAADMNGQLWRFTFTTSATSASGSYGGFNALFSGPLVGGTSGGLWIVSERLEFYDIDDNLVFQSGALVFGSGAVLTFTIDANATGGQSYSISGATSGNVSNVSFSDVGPFFRSAETLGAGEVPGTSGFELPGTFGNIDDGTAGESIVADAGSFALSGGAADLLAGAAVVAAAGSFALSGGAADLEAGTTATIVAEAGSFALTGGDASLDPGVTGAQIDADAGSFALSGGAADVVAVAKVEAAAGSFALTGGDADLLEGDAIVVGTHGLDAQPFPFSTRDALITLTTQASGSLVVLAAGGHSAEVTQPWTDNKGNTIRKLAAAQDYPDFAGYGTQVGVTHNPMTGGSNHQFTIQCANDDENTSFAVEVIGGKRTKHLHNNQNNASGGTTRSIGPIDVDGPAVLIAFWFGSSPVVPPFSGSSGPNGTGTGTPFTAVPDNGFSVVESYLFNFEFGEVQAACAVKQVTAAGSHSVTWTHSPAQGSQLWLVAVEGAAEIGADAGGYAVTGGAASLDASASATIDADAGAFAMSGGDATLQAAGAVLADAGAFALTGGDATLAAVAQVQADGASYALTGGDASVLAGSRVVADAGAYALAGGDAGLLGSAVVPVDAGAFALSGGEAALEGQGDQTIEAGAGSLALTGGDAEIHAVAVVDAEVGGFAITGGEATFGAEIAAEPDAPLPPRAPETGEFAQLVAEMDAEIIDLLG